MNNQSIIDKLIKKVTPVVIIIMAIGGGIYYFSQKIDIEYKILSTIQNIIGSFAFHPDLKIKDMAGALNSSEPWKLIIGILYSIAIIIAPMLSVAKLYTIFENFIVKNKAKYMKTNKNKILIFGYNDVVINWIKNNKNSDKVFVIYTEEELGKKELNKYVNVKNVNFENYELDNLGEKLQEFKKIYELTLNDKIIIYDYKNQGNNYNIFEKIIESNTMPDKMDVYVYINTDIDSVRLEKLYNKYIDDNRGKENKKNILNLEIFNNKEVVVRRLLAENKEFDFIENNNIEKDNTIHKLIIGFGSLGQEFLLQSMNSSVLTVDNNIVFDVYDIDIKNNRNCFLKHFSRSYLTKINDNEYTISDTHADGHLTIRFFEYDVKHKQMINSIDDNGKCNKYTSIFITLKDVDLVYSTYESIERYLLKYQPDDKINIFIRKYHSLNENYFKLLGKSNIIRILFDDKKIELDDLINDKIVKDAKTFNYIYENMSFSNNIDGNIEENDVTSTAEDRWKKLSYFKRKSSMATAMHLSNKEWYLKKYYKGKDDCINELEKSNILKRVNSKNGAIFVYNTTEEVLVNSMEKIQPVFNIVKMEHRRWCYYMASIGWSYSDRKDENGKWVKDEILRKNVCMCTYDDLKEKKIDVIKYDLMPLLYWWR